MSLTRRAFLARGVALGCSAAASPLFTPVSFASAPWDNRLVVLILRGAMDGLDAVRPVGDPDFAQWRPDRGRGQGIALDDFNELHPALAPLDELWRGGEMGIVQAVSTPYRDQRSHFDGQDILEAGTDALGLARDGWLNRMLQAVPGVEAGTTYTLGREEMLLTTGAAPVSNWTPAAALAISPQTERLLAGLTHDDPLFRDALDEALVLSGLATEEAVMVAGGGAMAASEMDPGMARRALQTARAADRSRGSYAALAEFAATQLKADARIATFSINGWDTHAAQSKTMASPLRSLAEVITTLKAHLGPVWGRTGVIAMTEFGRTVRLNGTAGSDHGTAGTMVFAGGALRGGRAHGDWPGLSEAALYQRRDLMPTSDVRAQAAQVMQGLFGLDRATLEEKIFPGMQMQGTAKLVL